MGKKASNPSAPDISCRPAPPPAPPKKMQCPECRTLRNGAACWKCGTETFEPAPEWDEPKLPPVEKIRELAKEVGYAIGVHGSLERDLDLIAAPWEEGAVGAYGLMQHIADGLGAALLVTEKKPLGRYACSIQMNGWFKLIDLSVCPVVRKDESGECCDAP